jgi:hypothetical protein
VVDDDGMDTVIHMANPTIITPLFPARHLPNQQA